QKPPTMRALPVPLHFSGGLPGSKCSSKSDSHSPANCWSHSCSLPGLGVSSGSCAPRAAAAASKTPTDHAAANVFMMPSLRSGGFAPLVHGTARLNTTRGARARRTCRPPRDGVGGGAAVESGRPRKGVVMRVSYVIVLVSDMGRSVAFYRDV